jgi:hypothetical protein
LTVLTNEHREHLVRAVLFDLYSRTSIARLAGQLLRRCPEVTAEINAKPGARSPRRYTSRVVRSFLPVQAPWPAAGQRHPNSDPCRHVASSCRTRLVLISDQTRYSSCVGGIGPTVSSAAGMPDRAQPRNIPVRQS